MRIGTSVHALTDFADDSKPFIQALDEAAECGFDSIMLMNVPGNPALCGRESPPCSLIDLAASDPKTVRAALSDAGLDAAALYQGCMDVADDDQAAESAMVLGELIRLARRIGCPLVIPNAGAVPVQGMTVDEKEPFIERIANVVMTALDQGSPETRIAIDVHYGGGIETIDDCERFFEIAPDARAGITLNIGHMTTCRQPGWTLVEDFPERVHAVAWKDHLLSPPPEATHPVYSVELGRGDSPFERYVEVLAPDDGTRRHLITFEHVPVAERIGALRRSLTYLQDLWDQADAR